MAAITFKITGVSPLLMHADTYVNAVDPRTKAHKILTSKGKGGKKTEEDSLAVAQSDWVGSLYHDESIGPFIPCGNLEGALKDGARRSTLGKNVDRAGLEVMEERNKLIYEGPRDIKGLWDKGFIDARSAKVGVKRVMRYRPKFPTGWAVEFIVVFDEEFIDRAQVIKAMEDAGVQCGIGDYRPGSPRGGKFGRFAVEVLS